MTEQKTAILSTANTHERKGVSSLKALNTVAMILVVVGGLNWGLVGAFDFNLVAAILGEGMIANIVYILVGLSAILVAVNSMKGSDNSAPSM